MDETLIGYARCSTDEQDLTAQRQALHALGVPPDRVYIDHGISGTKRERPGLDQALAAVRTGDTVYVRLGDKPWIVALAVVLLGVLRARRRPLRRA